MAGMPKRRARRRRRNPDGDVVPVVFRVWNGAPRSVIALFPTIEGSSHWGSVLSYEHVGQHGSADYNEVIASTRAATRAEYAPLARELRRIGYRLRIVKRRVRA